MNVQRGLAVTNLTVRFGGLVAVDGVTFEVLTGRLTGLIGPNGAGKTTIFNACTGLVVPADGKVFLHGRNISGLGPAARAQLGLSRTFQRMELFDRLTVAENVALGREARFAGMGLFAPLRTRRTERETVRTVTDEAIERCGLQALRGRRAGLLSTGQRRLVELARAVAGDFDVLLLDEPSSGLDPAETLAFGEILTSVVSERGTGILLVEHDMALVTSVCEYVYVLDFGRLIAEGTVSEIVASEAVRAAYLGSDAA